MSDDYDGNEIINGILCKFEERLSNKMAFIVKQINDLEERIKNIDPKYITLAIEANKTYRDLIQLNMERWQMTVKEFNDIRLAIRDINVELKK